MRKEVLLVVIWLTAVLLILLFAVAAHSFPNFTFSILGIVILVLLCILTEQWMTHDAMEFENR